LKPLNNKNEKGDAIGTVVVSNENRKGMRSIRKIPSIFCVPEGGGVNMFISINSKNQSYQKRSPQQK